MKYFQLDTCPKEDFSFCMLENSPDGTVSINYRMAEGEPMGADYPADARWRMSDDYKGIKLPTLIGCLDSILVLLKPAMEILRETGVAMECLPFTLLNHKGRVASEDYFIVNPLGSVECLDLAKSDIEWMDDQVGGDVIHVYECVLDAKKMSAIPAVFRVKEDPSIIILNETVAERLQALKPTNVYLTELEVAT
jgi:hypothetical protein